MTVTGKNYDRIIDTAKFPAYLRTFTDIPYADEIYSFLKAMSPGDSQVASGLVYDDFLWLAPIVEARHKAISSQLNRKQFDLVIELASGFSLRWLQLSNMKNYVDSDLASTVLLKQKMLMELKVSAPPAVKFCPLNAFEIDLLEFVKKDYPDVKSVAVVHEGLAQYFDKNELADLARNIFRLSASYEVEWISTDFSTIEQFTAHDVFDPNMKTLTAARRAASGRDLMNNAFEGVAQIGKYFDDLSYLSEYSLILKNPEKISSFKRIKMDQERFIQIFENHLRVWNLRPKR